MHPLRSAINFSFEIRLTYMNNTMFGWDKETQTQRDWINGAKVNMVSNYLICLVSFDNVNKEAAGLIYMYLVS